MAGAGTAIQIGLMVASIAAQVLLRPKAPNTSAEGPRLPTLDVMQSAYGGVVPFARGTVRSSGNVIWAMPIREVKHRLSEGGGKGGGGGKNTFTLYSYFGSFAMAIGEASEDARLLRVWADEKLIYDRTSETAVNKYKNASMRFYPGGASQMPDPLIQSDMGAANTPAFRHLAYLVFENLPLADFGNRLPQITVEVNWEGAGSSFTPTGVEAPVTTWNQRATTVWDKKRDVFFAFSASPYVLKRINRADMTVTATRDSSHSDGPVVPSGATLYGTPVLDPRSGDLYVIFKVGLVTHVRRIDGQSLRDSGDDMLIDSSSSTYQSSGGAKPYLLPGYHTVFTQDPVMEDIMPGMGLADFLVFVNDYGQVYTWCVAGLEPSFWNYTVAAYKWYSSSFLDINALSLLLSGVDEGFQGQFATPTITSGDQSPLVITSSTGAWPGYNSYFNYLKATPKVWGLTRDRDGVLWAIAGSPAASSTVTNTRSGPLLIRYERQRFQWIPTGLYFLAESQGGVPGVQQSGAGYSYGHIAYDETTHSLIVNVQADVNLYGFVRLDVETLAGLPSQFPGSFEEHADTVQPNIVADSVIAANLTYGPSVGYMATSSAMQFRQGPDFDCFITTSHTDSDRFYLWRATDLSLVGTYDLASWFPTGTPTFGAKGAIFYSGRDHTAMANVRFVSVHDDGWYKLDLDRFGATPITLGDVVRDATDRSEIDSAEIDADELDSIPINGLLVNQHSTGRQIIEPFMSSLNFVPVEEDFKIKFRLRDQPSSATITAEDLGAAAAGGKASRLMETRLQEEELPRRLEVVHADAERGYEANTQTAQRTRQPVSTQRSNDKVVIELPAAVTADMLKPQVESALYSAWVEREKQRFVTMPRYIEVSPGDAVTIETPDGRSLDARVITQRIGPSMLVEMETVRHDQDVFRSYAEGESTGLGWTEATVSFPGMTEVWPIDTNLVRDADDPAVTSGGTPIAAHMMVVFGPTAAGWRGAVLLKGGVDADWVAQEAGFNAPAWGPLLTDLPAVDVDTLNAPLLGPDETVVDPFSITIKPTYGAEELSSITDIEFFNGVNTAVIGNVGGWEIIQYRDVTDNGDGTYTLSHILRGRRGTEHVARRGHRGGVFIRLTTPDVMVANYTIPEELGTFLRFRADSSGSLDFEGVPRTGLVEANVLRPYAGCAFTAVENAGDIDIEWTRRTRVGGQDDFLDGVTEVPLSEATEEYEIEVYTIDDQDTPIRTVTGLTSPTWSYTAAMMAADSVTIGDEFAFYIYQISGTVDRGFPLIGEWLAAVDYAVASATDLQEYTDAAAATAEDAEWAASGSLDLDGSSEYAES